MALTATATPEVMKDICRSLKLCDPLLTCTSFDRLVTPCIWNVLPSGVKSVENIAKFCHHVKTSLQPCLSTIAPRRINQSDDN